MAQDKYLHDGVTMMLDIQPLDMLHISLTARNVRQIPSFRYVLLRLDDQFESTIPDDVVLSGSYANTTACCRTGTYTNERARI